MTQGNSVLVLTPDSRVVTNRYEGVDQSPRLEAADVQMEEKAPEGLLQLRRVMKEFPTAGKPLVATPWQFSPAHALVAAWNDSRRVVAVPALERALSDPVLLWEYHARYVFVDVGPEHAPPPEVRAALNEAGAGGVVVLDIPATDAGCVGGGKDEHYRGPWPAVRAVAHGPQTASSRGRLLGEQRIDLPTYVSRGCEGTRRTGKPVPTGREEFGELWGRAPASVRRRWPAEAVEDMKGYTRQALARYM